MTIKEITPPLIRTNTDDDPYGPKLRAFVRETKTARGRYPTAVECRAFGETLGVRFALPPTLAGRSVTVAPVTRALPSAPRVPPTRPVRAKLTEAERDAMFFRILREKKAAGINGETALRAAHVESYGDLYNVL